MRAPASRNALDQHPFVARLSRLVDLKAADLKDLDGIIDGELVIRKRRDLIADGYEYRKLCFVKDGYAVRYKLLRNGKREISQATILPVDVTACPAALPARGLALDHHHHRSVMNVCALVLYVQLCCPGTRNSAWRTPTSPCRWRPLCRARHQCRPPGHPVERLAHFLLEFHAGLEGRRPCRAGSLHAAILARGFRRRGAWECRFSTGGCSSCARKTDRQCERVVEFLDAGAMQSLAHYHPPALAPIPLSARPAEAPVVAARLAMRGRALAPTSANSARYACAESSIRSSISPTTYSALFARARWFRIALGGACIVAAFFGATLGARPAVPNRHRPRDRDCHAEPAAAFASRHPVVLRDRAGRRRAHCHSPQHGRRRATRTRRQERQPSQQPVVESRYRYHRRARRLERERQAERIGDGHPDQRHPAHHRADRRRTLGNLTSTVTGLLDSGSARPSASSPPTCSTSAPSCAARWWCMPSPRSPPIGGWSPTSPRRSRSPIAR